MVPMTLYRSSREPENVGMECCDRGDASSAANWRFALFASSNQSVKFTIREEFSIFLVRAFSSTVESSLYDAHHSASAYLKCRFVKVEAHTIVLFCSRCTSTARCSVRLHVLRIDRHDALAQTTECATFGRARCFSPLINDPLALANQLELPQYLKLIL